MPKTIRMARNKKGQFVKGHRASNPRHHKKHAKKRAKHNYVSGGGAVFPMANRRGGKRKHNPSIPLPGIGSVELPIGTVLGVTGGIALPPITQGLLVPMLGLAGTAAQYPGITTLAFNGAVLAGAYFAFGRTAARDVLVGELAAFLVKQIQSISATMAGSLSRPIYYAGGRMAGYTPPTARGRVMAGYMPPTARGRVMAGYPFTTRQRGMALLNGGLGQINSVRRSPRLQSRFNQV